MRDHPDTCDSLHIVIDALARRAAALAGLTVPLLAPLDAPLAKTFCSEPVQPYCVRRTDAFPDAAARDRCGRDVAEYVKEMAVFIECLGTRQGEAQQRAADIEARFHCKAKGETDCP